MNIPEHYFDFGPLVITLVVVAANVITFVWPVAIIVERTGRSRWWAFLILTGPGAIVGLWMLALCRWPALERH
jgi:hypothetical protein